MQTSYYPTAQAWVLDSYGNPVGGGSSVTGPGFGQWLSGLASRGASQGWQNTQNRMGAINPQTGLPYNGSMPMNAADNAYIASQLGQSANSFNNNMYQQQLAMLGYGGGGGSMMGGGGIGQTPTGGGGVGTFTGGPGSFNPLNPMGGPQVTGLPPGGGVNPAGIPTGNSSGLPMGVNPALSNTFNSTLMSSMSDPGFTPGQIQNMKNNASDSLSSAQSQAELMGQNQAAAAGMGNSGASLAGQNAIHSDYAGQISNAQRGIDIGAANEAQAQKMQALGTAGGYLSSMYANQMHSRDLAIGLMSQQRQTAPSAGGAPANWSGNSGAGGMFNGANVGPNSGSANSFNFSGSNGGGFGGFSGPGIVSASGGGGYGGGGGAQNPMQNYNPSNGGGGGGGAPALPPGMPGGDPFSGNAAPVPNAPNTRAMANPFAATSTQQNMSVNPFAGGNPMGAQSAGAPRLGGAMARPRGAPVNPFVYNPVNRIA